MDLVESGAWLWEILQAGEWRSPAFLAYLDCDQLESGAAMEAQGVLDAFVDDSSGDEAA